MESDPLATFPSRSCGPFWKLEKVKCGERGNIAQEAASSRWYGHAVLHDRKVRCLSANPWGASG